jgi:mRNA interferase RelE/StbE
MCAKYSVQLSKRAHKDFQKLDPSLQKPIHQALIKLTTSRTPQQFKSLKGKSIAQYRLRVGDYRILYDVYDEDYVVLILRLGHRKDIYR